MIWASFLEASVDEVLLEGEILVHKLGVEHKKKNNVILSTRRHFVISLLGLKSHQKTKQTPGYDYMRCEVLLGKDLPVSGNVITQNSLGEEILILMQGMGYLCLP